MHEPRSKKIVSTGITAMTALAIGAAFVFQLCSAARAAGLGVSAADLSTAGFTRPAALPPANGRFQIQGVTYFRVAESVAAAHPEWAKEGVADVVAVSIVPTTWSQDAVTGGTEQKADNSGRVGICNSRPGYYFCVTGPDETKDRALVDLLKSKPI